jgi:polysaccharide biosynthesis transport protein
MRLQPPRGPLPGPPRLPRAGHAPPPLTNAQWQSNRAWGYAPVEEKVDVREIWRKLWRGRWLIMLVTIAGSLLGYGIIEQLTPRYTASSSVMLQMRQPQIVESQAVISELPLDADVFARVLEGEVELIVSRELAKTVVSKLKLHDDPEFNSDLMHDDPEFNSDLVKDENGFSLTTLWAYWRSELTAPAREFWDSLAKEQADPTELDGRRDKVVDAFLDNIEATQVGNSPVISISFTSENPRTATDAANTIAESYISAQLESKFDATRQANSFLQARIAELRADVEKKESVIEEFRGRSGLIKGKDVTVTTQQMSELASQLVAARVERQRVESQLQQVERVMSSPNGAAAAAEVLESPLIQNLRLQEAQLRRELAELLEEYGPRYPTILNRRANLQDIQVNILGEINKIVTSLRNQVEAARRREVELQASLDQLSERVAQLNNEEVKLRDLEREADAGRRLLENFLGRSQETASQEGIQQPDAKIISFAEMPEDPRFPNKRLLMLLAFCGSAFAGVSLSYGLQAFDRSFHTSGEVRDALQMPVLEIIPAVRRPSRGTSPIDVVTRPTTSSYSEALRNLYVTLLAVGNPPKVVLFTSAVPEEGKTALALSFGRFIALVNRSCVVVDCDLRKSSVHRSLGGRRTPGLVDYLLGKSTLDEIIQTDNATSLDYVASGSPLPNPTDLLSSPALAMGLANLARRYDVVLLDSAPVLAVADTRCLHSFVDQTVFVIRWSFTLRNAAREAVHRLQESGFTFGCAVLNLVDLKSYHLYDDGYKHEIFKNYSHGQ